MEVIAVGGRKVSGDGGHVVADVGWAASRHGTADPDAAEVAQEEALELVAEDAVDDEIHRRVEADQQIADAGHLVHQDVGRLEDVDRHRQNVEDEEDGNHAQQHRCQTDLPLLRVGQQRPLPIRLPHLQQQQQQQQQQ